MDVGGAATFGMSGACERHEECFAGGGEIERLNSHVVIGIYERIHPLLEGISFLSFEVESSDVMEHN